MGTLGGNGGSWPPDGGGPPDDLPEIPPEWGVIVIPDDPAELAEEAARVRRQLRHDTRSRTWRRRLHLPPPKPRPPAGEELPTLGVPLLIVSIAVLATLASLFAVAWPAQPRPNPIATTAAAPKLAGTPSVLPDVPLDVPGAGRLSATLPAVILLVDGCTCADLVASTATAAAAADPRIGVVAVARTAPSLAAAPSAGTGAAPRIWAVADPAGALRAAVPGLPAATTGQPVALLADAGGRLVRVVVAPTSVDEFRADLSRLKPA
jgi:hypothetical protein